MLIRLCSVWIGRTGTIRVCQQALDGGQNGAYIVTWRPGFLNDVQAQGTITVDVWVKPVLHILISKLCFVKSSSSVDRTLLCGLTFQT